MQCADIFFLDVDFCQLGVDQRKVNMLAIKYCKDEKRKHVIISWNDFRINLRSIKMPKSNPDSAIFM
jgi:tyrosyl-tRNA synthetase